MLYLKSAWQRETRRSHDGVAFLRESQGMVRAQEESTYEQQQSKISLALVSPLMDRVGLYSSSASRFASPEPESRQDFTRNGE
jgi:hypothetical protein